MRIAYDTAADLLYLRFDDRKQQVINRRVAEHIVLDIGEDEKIVAIEFLDASRHVDLARLLPVEYAGSIEPSA